MIALFNSLGVFLDIYIHIIVKFIISNMKSLRIYKIVNLSCVLLSSRFGDSLKFFPFHPVLFGVKMA